MSNPKSSPLNEKVYTLFLNEYWTKVSGNIKIKFNGN